jgi:hypothetical protein
VQCIRQEWTAKDGEAAQQLVAKLQDAAQALGHLVSHADAVGSTVFAELTTAAKGELVLLAVGGGAGCWVGGR